MRIDLEGKTVLDESIAILRQFEPPEGYWLAFSGGKDSVVLYELAKRAGVKFDAHYNLTTIDPPELVKFIRRHYPEVAWERPRETFYRLVERRGFPTRRTRWCCFDLKERGGNGRVVLVGIRAQESQSRKRRGIVEKCLRFPSKVMVSPILRWEAEEVWEFIRREGLPYCSLYDEGWKRLGCVPCPFASAREVARSRLRWPRIWENVRRAFHRRWEHPRPISHDLAALGGDPAWLSFWEDADAAFEWWCSRNRPYPGNEDEEHRDDPQLFGSGMESLAREMR